MTSTYTPIDCNYYDLLEIAAMRRQKSIIAYQEGEQILEVEAVIEDLWAKNGEEFVRLSNGLTFRLDRLISLNGKVRPGLNGEEVSCRIKR